MSGSPVKRRIGFHLSVSGNFSKTLEHALDLETNAVQIFLKNPNQWAGKSIEPEDISRFRTSTREHDLYLAAHTGYLINCAGSGDVLQKSATALADEMKRADDFGIENLVLHPGSRKDTPLREAITQVAGIIDMLYTKNDFSVFLLIETMAGQGSSLGRTFEELAGILNASDFRDRLGICLDTAHVWAAGYDPGDPKTLDMFDAILGLDTLKLIHLNDSKRERGSAVDRHEHIGQGMIGTEKMSVFLNDARILNVPVIMETPKGKDDTFDRMNLETVMSLIQRGSDKGAP